jgi:polysaccharide biosynthesis transport protein
MSVARTIMPAFTGAAAQNGRDVGTFQLSDVIRLIQSRHKLILGVAASLIALTALIVALLPTLYSATAVVMLEQQRNNIADASSVLSSLPTDAASVQNQIQILTSRDLASRVVTRLHLESDPEFNGGSIPSSPSLRGNAANGHERVIDAFLKRLSVESEGLSTAIAISFKAGSAEKAAQIANAVAEVYVQSRLDTKFTATRETTEWLESRVRELSRQVQTADAAVERYKAEHNLTEAANGVPLSDEQIGAVNTQLLQAKADLAQRQATYSRVQAQMNTGHGADISQAIASPLIIQLRSQEADLIRSEAELTTKYGPKHPKLIAVQSQRRDLEQKIAQEVDRLAGSLANDVSVSRAQVATMQSSLAAVEQLARNQNFLRVKLKSLEVNAASTHSIYEAFVTRLRAIQDQNGIDTPDARVISHAAPPNAPSSPHRTMILAASIPIALLFGFLSALVAERLAPLAQQQNVQRVAAPPPVLARLEGVAYPRAADLVVDRPTTPFARGVQELAANIVDAAAKGGPRVIAITSPQAGEGATTVAISLARAASLSGKRVVVLDANLRAPLAARLAGHRQIPVGLLEVLTGREPFSRGLVADTRSGALLLSSAQPRLDPSRVFASAQLRQLLQHLRSASDLVFIAAPPVLEHRETEMLARAADAVLLVARADGMQRNAFTASIDLLRLRAARAVAVVLTA